ncbi:uncharacterized protein LOC142979622 [Anticarsia gemmatalis]|uniref:uncharacterized protein LOC142979622 n=1 Tax=Anticarsia gemmatalis TaxID=129554 RepID=UPI003F76285A
MPIVIITRAADRGLLNSTLDFNDTVSKKRYFFHALIVIVFDTCDDVSFYDFVHTDKLNKQLIIITEPSNDCNDKLEDIAHIVDRYDITFLLLNVIKDRNKMQTFIPTIDENTCQQAVGKLTHINTCINGTLRNKKVFPSKNPTNLNKCLFKVGMATLYPFSQIENKDSLKTYDHINNSVGCDMEIMEIVAEYFNATLDLYYIFRKEENPFGDYEFIKYLQNGSLDVCAGGLYRIYGRFVEYSGVYANQAVMWMYLAKRTDRSWESLIGKVNGLYIFVIFYISYSIIWYFICVFDGDAVSLRNTLLYGWGALIGANSLQDARTLKQKLLNLGYLVMCIHLSAYISIQLYSFLTIKGPPQMLNTNDAVMASGRVPFLKPSTKYFVSDKKYLEFANTSADCSSFVDCAEKTLQHNGLTLLLQASFFHFQSETAVRGEARVLRTAENVLTVYNEMLIRRDSPLVVKFQKIIQTLFEAGITQRLYEEAVGILVRDKADSANSNLIMSSYSCRSGCAITLVQFAGVFYLWIIGCVVSCIVFVIEVCIQREK